MGTFAFEWDLIVRVELEFEVLRWKVAIASVAHDTLQICIHCDIGPRVCN